MRLILLLVLLALPALAQGDPKLAMIAPEPGCEAPALLRPAQLRQVDEPGLAPPFRFAMLSCPMQGDGARKRPLRWT